MTVDSTHAPSTFIAAFVLIAALAIVAHRLVVGRCYEQLDQNGSDDDRRDGGWPKGDGDKVGPRPKTDGWPAIARRYRSSLIITWCTLGIWVVIALILAVYIFSTANPWLRDAILSIAGGASGIAVLLMWATFMTFAKQFADWSISRKLKRVETNIGRADHATQSNAASTHGHLAKVADHWLQKPKNVDTVRVVAIIAIILIAFSADYLRSSHGPAILKWLSPSPPSQLEIQQARLIDYIDEITAKLSPANGVPLKDGEDSEPDEGEEVGSRLENEQDGEATLPALETLRTSVGEMQAAMTPGMFWGRYRAIRSYDPDYNPEADEQTVPWRDEEDEVQEASVHANISALLFGIAICGMLWLTHFVWIRTTIEQRMTNDHRFSQTLTREFIRKSLQAQVPRQAVIIGPSKSGKWTLFEQFDPHMQKEGAGPRFSNRKLNDLWLSIGYMPGRYVGDHILYAAEYRVDLLIMVLRLDAFRIEKVNEDTDGETESGSLKMLNKWSINSVAGACNTKAKCRYSQELVGQRTQEYLSAIDLALNFADKRDGGSANGVADDTAFERSIRVTARDLVIFFNVPADKNGEVAEWLASEANHDNLVYFWRSVANRFGVPNANDAGACVLIGSATAARVGNAVERLVGAVRAPGGNHIETV